MKKKNEPKVAFNIIKKDKRYEIVYTTYELLQMVEKKKKEKDTSPVQLKFSIDGEQIDISFTTEEIIKYVKLAELQLKIIPRKLETYLIDITQNFTGKNILKVNGRDEEIEKIWSCLSKKRQSNAILVGDTDVGKTTIAYEIARQISTSECPAQFRGIRFLELNTSEILEIKSNFLRDAETERIRDFIIKEKENIIIYVDNFLHMKCDEKLLLLLHEILKKHNIKFISTIRYEDFEQYFLSDNFINKYLNEIEILEPEPEEIFDMIKAKVILLQKQYKVKISKKMVNFAIATASLTDSISSEPGNVLNILDRAFSEASRKEKKIVDKQCILSCYNSYLKLYKNTTIEDKKMIAYHEIGHYILFKKCPALLDIKVEFVSILPMLDFLGINHTHNILGKALNYTKEYYEDLITVYLGGRVGEAKLTNKFSTGASADLNVANTIAKQMIMLYGLSNDSKNKNRSYVINYLYSDDFLLTEKHKEAINDEILSIIGECFEKAESIINNNLELLERLANELVEKEIMTDEELESICKEYEN